MDQIYSEVTNSLKDWFEFQKRDLPWRHYATPYGIWVSEIMLQQTQVSVVVPYFERWMATFPDIQSLAQAPQEKVLKMWEGLGYYSRARNLHAGAKYIVEHYQGCLPNNKEHLQAIKGLGPYTIGAILSFAYHQKIPAVDGNIKRVIARLFALKDDISKTHTFKYIESIVSDLLPENESWIVNEALIELGALVCKKRPDCGHCPLKKLCKAYINGQQDSLPYNSKKIDYVKLNRTVYVIRHQNLFLVKKGELGKVLSDLYEFAFIDHELIEDGQQLEKSVEQNFHLKVQFQKKLACTHQSFTKFRVQLYPFLFETTQMKIIEKFEWKSKKELLNLTFSSGHRRILLNL